MYCIFESYMIDLVIIKPCKGHSLFQWHIQAAFRVLGDSSFIKYMLFVQTCIHMNMVIQTFSDICLRHVPCYPVTFEAKQTKHLA